MAGELDGKIAIVTGASRGIGLACVEAFLEAGAMVVGCSLDKDVTSPVSSRYRHHTVDVTKPAELEGLIADAGKAHAPCPLRQRAHEPGSKQVA